MSLSLRFSGKNYLASGFGSARKSFGRSFQAALRSGRAEPLSAELVTGSAAGVVLAMARPIEECFSLSPGGLTSPRTLRTAERKLDSGRIRIPPYRRPAGELCASAQSCDIRHLRRKRFVLGVGGAV